MKLEKYGQYKFNIIDKQGNLFGYIHFDHDCLSDDRMLTYCIIEQLPREGDKHKFYSGISVLVKGVQADNVLGFQMALQRACDTMFPAKQSLSHKAYKRLWHQIRVQVRKQDEQQAFDDILSTILDLLEE